jgi:hypothetical protein
MATLVECPQCGQQFTPEEGTLRLHGGGLGDTTAPN